MIELCLEVGVVQIPVPHPLAADEAACTIVSGIISPAERRIGPCGGGGVSPGVGKLRGFAASVRSALNSRIEFSRLAAAARGARTNS